MIFYLSLTLMTLICIVQITQQEDINSRHHPTNWDNEAWTTAFIAAFLWPFILLIFAAIVYMRRNR